MADEKKGVSPTITGFAGAILGAVAAASAIALSDPKNRKRAEDFLKDLKEQGEKGLSELKKEADKLSFRLKKGKTPKQLRSGKGVKK